MEKLSLMQRIERLPREVVGAHASPPELVAFTVIVSRNLNGWKQSTLADFAGVSISTIERIERGDRVRPAQLDKVALALGHEAGYFTSPREQTSPQEAAASIADVWGSLVPIEVETLDGHKFESLGAAFRYVESRYGVRENTMRERMRSGLSLEQAAHKPLRKDARRRT